MNAPIFLFLKPILRILIHVNKYKGKYITKVKLLAFGKMSKMMAKIKSSTYNALRKSEAFFKTDMIYMALGGFWVGLGQIISAFIAFVSSLVFANFIPKDIYGNYKFIISATSILGAISLTGMGTIVTQAVARGAEGILKDAIKTTVKWGSIMVAAAFLSAIYYFLRQNITLSISMVIAGLAMLVINSYGLYGNYLTGKKNSKSNTIYGIILQAITTTLVIGVAVTTKNILLIVSAYFVSNTLLTLLFYKIVKKKNHINEVRDDSLIRYGKHISLMGFFGTLANQFDKILIFHYLGSFQLAIYAFAQAIPDQFKGILKSIFNLAMPKYAESNDRGLRHSIMKKFGQLTALVALAILVYILIAKYIFVFLFPKYLDAVFYSEIYMLGMITIPGITLFGIYFQLKKATRKMYQLNVISNISTLVITFILIYKYGLEGAVIANGLSWLVMLIAHWYYFSREQGTLLVNNQIT